MTLGTEFGLGRVGFKLGLGVVGIGVRIGNWFRVEVGRVGVIESWGWSWGWEE